MFIEMIMALMRRSAVLSLPLELVFPGYADDCRSVLGTTAFSIKTLSIMTFSI
jgi:hypothetical protein